MLRPGIELRHTLTLPETRKDQRKYYYVAWSPGGRTIATASDTGIELWDSQDGVLHRAIQWGRGYDFTAWTPDGQSLVGISSREARLWDLTTGKSVRLLKQGFEDLLSLSWSPDGQSVATRHNSSIKLWDSRLQELQCIIPTLPTYYNFFPEIVWSPDSRHLAVLTNRWIVQLWGINELKHNENLKGRTLWQAFHYDETCNSIAWSPSGRALALALRDKTIRILDTTTGSQTNLIECSFGVPRELCFSSDGLVLASYQENGDIQLWRCGTWQDIAYIEGASFYKGYDRIGGSIAFSPKAPVLLSFSSSNSLGVWDLDLDILFSAVSGVASVCYKNAKVVLVGDTGVGKSALGLVLTGQEFEPTESTHGRKIWTLERLAVSLNDGFTEIRETLLWDLAGQPGYRVFHRQHLDEVAVALVLFDSRSEVDPFAGVAYWARALDEATRGFPLVKFLVASRIDRGGPPVSDDRILEFCEHYGFADCFEVSAKRGDGVKELAKSLYSALSWDRLPRVNASHLFRDMKLFVIAEKEAGFVLEQREALLARYRKARPNVDAPENTFNTCLGRLEAAGLIKRLTFGDLVLLQPELLDNYCAWLAQAARKEPDGLGFISDRRARTGDFPMDYERPLRDKGEERLLLTATVEDIVGRGIALRQPTGRGDMLVFPSELRADMPDYPGNYVRTITFVFEGPVKAIYATLVVCLTHAPAFNKEKFYRNTALFRSVSNEICGITVNYTNLEDDAQGQMTVFFDPETGKAAKLTFLRYVNEQLEEMAFSGTVKRERIYQCECTFVIPQDAIKECTKRRKNIVICPVCGKSSLIDDLAEQSAKADKYVEELRQLANDERERQTRLAVLEERERGAEFHVFLCHNSKDKSDVRLLATKLREHGILPWLDEKGILAGKQFIPELETIIDRVSAMAVIVGRHWLGHWQTQEYYAFLQRYIENYRATRRKRLALMPVLLPDAPSEPDLPIFLRGFNWIDFRQAEGLENREQMSRFIQAILIEG